MTSIPLSDRMKWFVEARFGLSLHFGLYSIAGRGEWLRSTEQLSVEEYQQYFDSFQPDAGCAREWARAARLAGAKYCVLTAKHHDGFCLWDSALTSYKSTNTPARRDIIREYVDALREEGIRVGLYYSLVDWHHPDYPAWGDRQHPLRHDPASRARDEKCDWPRYLEYMHGQLEELLGNYGPIDVLVFDFSYWDFIGEKWGASELMQKIRRLAPNIVVNDRLGFEAIKQANPPAYVGDYDHAEQNIPREPVTNALGQAVPWEAWMTINNCWTFDPHDQNWKSAQTLVRALVNCVSKGGNLMLNIGPDARGHLPAQGLRILEEVGQWIELQWREHLRLRRCGIRQTRMGPLHAKRRAAFRSSAGTDHWTHQLARYAWTREKRARVGRREPKAPLSSYWNPGVQTFDAPDDIFFNLGKPPQATFPLPDARDTVVRFERTSEDEHRQICERDAEEFTRATARVPF
jgi:alpha-L-fucosidase